MKKSELKRRREMRKQGYPEDFIKSNLGILEYQLSTMSERSFKVSGGKIIDNHDGTITIIV